MRQNAITVGVSYELYHEYFIKGRRSMHETLPSLISRALMGKQRPLEFYLREQSRLPGTRANLELVNDVAHLLATQVRGQPENVWALLRYLSDEERRRIPNDPTAEFVTICGIVGYGTCAALLPRWRSEAFALLEDFACSPLWRVRQGVEIAFQHLLGAAPGDTTSYLTILATQGNYFQQRAAVAALAEPRMLQTSEMIHAALSLQHIVLERLHSAPGIDRKREDFRVLRQALGYTLSVVTAAAPECGFALMRECAVWGDPDIHWILRENLKKKRLAKYAEFTDGLNKLLA